MEQVSTTDVLKQLKVQNSKRAAEIWVPIEEYTEEFLCMAIAGEVGEMCNLIKKSLMGEKVDERLNIPIKESVAHEAADVVIYLDLLCQKMGIDLQTAIVNKFNLKSWQVGSMTSINN
jgi:NTP pyrophosphatase (non-canonical NTP hydrolase)